VFSVLLSAKRRGALGNEGAFGHFTLPGYRAAMEARGIEPLTS
jgi:hypothetical protein